MAKIAAISISLVFLAAACNVQPQNREYADGVVRIAGREVIVELADTHFKKNRGLSGRDSLVENHGMLFVFDPPQRPGFWMKDMLFPIDIIWIRDGKIAQITENIQPEPGKPDSELAVYEPSVEIDHVLELNANWAARHNLTIGDEIIIKIDR